MANRKQSSPAEDFIAIASKLPWWASLILAVVGYLVLRTYANQPIAVSTIPGKTMDVFIPAIVKGLATFGQYALPTLLAIAAGLSWYKTRRTEAPHGPASSVVKEAGQNASQKSPSCPVCSSAMKLRAAKRGSNAGKSFWGCSDYPQCKGIRTAD